MLPRSRPFPFLGDQPISWLCIPFIRGCGMDNWATEGMGRPKRRPPGGAVQMLRWSWCGVWCMVSLGTLFPRIRGALFHLWALPLELPTRPCGANHCPSLGLRDSSPCNGQSVAHAAWFASSPSFQIGMAFPGEMLLPGRGTSSPSAPCPPPALLPTLDGGVFVFTQAGFPMPNQARKAFWKWHQLEGHTLALGSAPLHGSWRDGRLWNVGFMISDLCNMVH